MIDGTADYIVLGIDVASYSQKQLREQKLAQETLDRLLARSIKAIWPQTNNKPIWIDAGDGGYALFRGQESLVIETIASFQALVTEDNLNRSENAQLHMRFGLHKDQIDCWEGELGRKYTGNALNNCARLLSGMNRLNLGQVVCTRPIVEAITSFRIPPVTVTRLRDIVDKHGLSHSVYNLHRSPGFGIMPDTSDQHPNPLERPQSI